MELDYLVYSVKMNAWWGTQGVYTSDPAKARRFPRDEALAFCRTRYSNLDGAPQAIPVRAEDLDATMEHAK